jgi:hypothetical protein
VSPDDVVAGSDSCDQDSRAVVLSGLSDNCDGLIQAESTSPDLVTVAELHNLPLAMHRNAARDVANDGQIVRNQG